jgi:hypothetical protein
MEEFLWISGAGGMPAREHDNKVLHQVNPSSDPKAEPAARIFFSSGVLA